MKIMQLEIRGTSTLYTVIAIKTIGDNPNEIAHFQRGGWGDSLILINITAA